MLFEFFPRNVTTKVKIVFQIYPMVLRKYNKRFYKTSDIIVTT